MGNRFFLLLLAGSFACNLDLSQQRPPLNGSTLSSAIRRAALRNRCPAPEGLFLNDNEIEFLPETSEFTELAWACSGNPFSDVEAAFDPCKELCANNTQCAYISLLATRCLLYSSSGCNSTKNDIVANVTASYRKDATLADMDYFKAVKELDLSNNKFVEVSPGIGGLGQLTQLLLGGNQITTLPEYGFPRLTSLRYLKLANNSLTNLTGSGLFGPQLTDLILNRNNLSSFPPGIFRSLGNLRFLDFAFNKFSTLPPKVFSNLTSLKALYLDVNPLTSLQKGAFDGLSRLEDLRMESALASSLPNTIFRPLTSLTLLSMIGWRQLTEIPSDLFFGLSNLQEIVMSGSNLTAIPSGLFQNLSSLTSLEFHGAPLLKSLPFDLFTGLSKLTRLEMGPAMCSGWVVCPGRAIVGNKLRTFRVNPTASPSSAPTASPTLSPTTPVPTSHTVAPTNEAKSLRVVGPTPSSSQVVYREKESVVNVRGTGFIVGVTVGAVCFVILVCLLCWCCWRRRSPTKDKATVGAPTDPTSPDAPLVITSSSVIEFSETSSHNFEGVLPLRLALSSTAPMYNCDFSVETPTPTTVLSLPVFGKGARIYTAVKVLGKGSNGNATTYLVTSPQGKLYVIKTLLCVDPSFALRKVRGWSFAPASERLLKMLDFFFEGPLLCVVMSYCQGGSLQDMVARLIELSEVERILREIAEGLELLHGAGMVHRDLNANNIFFKHNMDPKTVVIGDLGMTKFLDQATNSYTYAAPDASSGRMLYQAPEADPTHVSASSDMWAVGCVGFELLSGQPLSERYAMHRFVVGKASQEEIEDLLNGLPENRKNHVAFRMVRRLLLCDPEARLGAYQLKTFERGYYS